jgi:hypothetical protein
VVLEQRILVSFVQGASLRTIHRTCPHPDWLGYLGFVLAYTQEAQAADGILAHKWGWQLRSMYPRLDEAGRIPRRGVLTPRHMEAFEYEAVSPITPLAGRRPRPRPLSGR